MRRNYILLHSYGCRLQNAKKEDCMRLEYISCKGTQGTLAYTIYYQLPNVIYMAPSISHQNVFTPVQ